MCQLALVFFWNSFISIFYPTLKRKLGDGKMRLKPEKHTDQWASSVQTTNNLNESTSEFEDFNYRMPHF